MLLKVIGKMCRSENPPSSFNAILTSISKSNFTDKLVRFLHGLKEKLVFFNYFRNVDCF